MGESTELGMSFCSSTTKIVLIRTRVWHYSGWKKTEYGSHVEEIYETCRSWRTNMFSRSCIFQHECKPKEDTVIQHGEMFASRISATAQPHAKTVESSYDMEGHCEKCVEKHCELAHKKTEQWCKVSTLVVQKQACSRSYIHHTNDVRQYCHMGNTAHHCRLSLFQDSDFAGDLEDSKWTFGNRALVPLIWMCTKVDINVSQFRKSGTERYPCSWFVGCGDRSVPCIEQRTNPKDCCYQRTGRLERRSCDQDGLPTNKVRWWDTRLEPTELRQISCLTEWTWSQRSKSNRLTPKPTRRHVESSVMNGASSSSVWGHESFHFLKPCSIEKAWRWQK